MAGAPPVRSGYVLSRWQLALLAVSTACIAVLSFFVGLEVGRGDGVEEVAPAGWLPDADEQRTLQALLAEVEAATQPEDAAGRPADDALAFPGLLDGDDPGVLPRGAAAAVEARVAVEPLPGDPRPVPPDTPVAGAVPEGGWSVQVVSVPTPEEADARVAELAEAGWRAYRVAALVDGRTWYRVRVGGFDDEEAARRALPELRARTGGANLAVVEAP